MLPIKSVRESSTKYFQFPFVVGQKWQAEYYSKPLGKWIKAENEVVGRELVTTAAGTFPVFRIERRVFFMYVACDLCDHNRYWWTYNYFYSPQTRSVLKYRFQSEQQRDMGGSIFDL